MSNGTWKFRATICDEKNNVVNQASFDEWKYLGDSNYLFASKTSEEIVYHLPPGFSFLTELAE